MRQETRQAIVDEDTCVFFRYSTMSLRGSPELEAGVFGSHDDLEEVRYRRRPAELGLAFEVTSHRGIDDARNIARVYHTCCPDAAADFSAPARISTRKLAAAAGSVLQGLCNR